MIRSKKIECELCKGKKNNTTELLQSELSRMVQLRCENEIGYCGTSIRAHGAPIYAKVMNRS